jgi:SAM-dependent methyltransferase
MAAASSLTSVAMRATTTPQISRSTLSRRQLLVGSALAVGCGGARSNVGAGARDFGNFRSIYGDAAQRAAFRNFLVNVFHLYPEQELDALIAEVSRSGAPDGEVYAAIEQRLPEVTPMLGAVRYSLPALAKQKHEMASQTQQLLADVGTVEGYLEIGSHGRYLDELQARVNVRGPIYTTAPIAPTYGIIDIVDRGQLSYAGQVVPWNDYAGFSDSGIDPGSLDLVTIYIGIHHATEEARAPYLQSLRSLLSSKGRVVIRDHDVTNDQMRHLVGLAHDVFNVGTHETWATNEAERRNFYSLDYLVSIFEAQGFQALPARLRQDGDPTSNTLLCFQKA